MPTVHNRDDDAVLNEADVRHPPSSPATTLREGALSFRQAALTAGAAYLITYATSIYGLFFVRPALIVDGDAARTASNIVAHAQLFRIGVVSDLLTGVGVVILNLALYELLAPVGRGLARLAALWRLVEVSVGSVITVTSFIVLSLLSGADYLQTFQPRELQALAYLFVGAQTSGYIIMLLFFGFGSTTYMYLLVRSRYVPKAFALLGLGGSALVVLFALAGMLYPASVAAAFAAVRALPAVALALLALIIVPILAFEVLIGISLLVKGIRAPKHT